MVPIPLAAVLRRDVEVVEEGQSAPVSLPRPEDDVPDRLAVRLDDQHEQVRGVETVGEQAVVVRDRFRPRRLLGQPCLRDQGAGVVLRPALQVGRELVAPHRAERDAHVATSASSRCTRPASTSTNAGSAFGISIRRRRIPSSCACRAATSSMSQRISRWSETNPIGQTSAVSTPALAQLGEVVEDVRLQPRLARGGLALVGERPLVADASRRRRRARLSPAAWLGRYPLRRRSGREANAR